MHIVDSNSGLTTVPAVVTRTAVKLKPVFVNGKGVLPVDFMIMIIGLDL